MLIILNRSKNLLEKVYNEFLPSYGHGCFKMDNGFKTASKIYNWSVRIYMIVFSIHSLDSDTSDNNCLNFLVKYQHTGL